jgi:WD40 repeat protein
VEISAEAENMALSADAKRLLTASGFADARLWDLTAATAAAGDSIAGAVHACATSAEATAAACSDGTVRVLGAGGQEVLRGHAGTVADCRFGPDGSWLVSAGTDGTLRRWQDHGHTVLAECDSPLNAVAVGGAWAVAVATDGSVVIVGLDPAREPRLLTGHKAQAWSCAADPSGRFAVTTGYDGTARIWSAPDGDALATLDGPAPHVLCCDVNRAGAVVCGDGDGALRVWDPPEWRCRHVLSGHDGDVVTCAWTPDGASVLSGGRDGVLRLWDARGGDLRSRGMGHFDRILACAIAADGRLCASTGTDSSLRVWKLPDLHGHAVMPLPGDGRCVAFHPSRAAISCGGMGFVSTFDMLPVPQHALGPQMS